MMVHRPPGRTAFTLALLVFVAALAWMTWPIGSRSYLIPAFILVPTALLLVIQLIGDLRGRDAAGSPDDAAVLVRAFAWLAVMPVLLAATGLVYGAALYTVAYLRLGNRESWTLSLACALAVGVGLALVAHGLRMPQFFAGPFW